MKVFAIVLLVMVSFESFCQETDTYQPDSVYRVNHVKTRLVRDEAASPWEMLLSYDSLGRLEMWTLMKDGVQLQRIVYQYDDKGKQVEEVYWHGTKFAEKATLAYDELSRVIGKYLKYDPGAKPKMDILISYKPSSEIKRYWKLSFFLHCLIWSMSKGFMIRTKIKRNKHSFFCLEQKHYFLSRG